MGVVILIMAVASLVLVFNSLYPIHKNKDSKICSLSFALDQVFAKTQNKEKRFLFKFKKRNLKISGYVQCWPVLNQTYYYIQNLQIKISDVILFEQSEELQLSDGQYIIQNSGRPYWLIIKKDDWKIEITIHQQKISKYIYGYLPTGGLVESAPYYFCVLANNQENANKLAGEEYLKLFHAGKTVTFNVWFDCQNEIDFAQLFTTLNQRRAKNDYRF